jgi:hypothetical protein
MPLGDALVPKTRRIARSARRPRKTGAAPEPLPIVHSSLYLPEPVYEALRRIAFDEHAKIHDLVMQGIDTVLRRHGYPSVEDLKAGKRW